MRRLFLLSTLLMVGCGINSSVEEESPDAEITIVYQPGPMAVQDTGSLDKDSNTDSAVAEDSDSTIVEDTNTSFDTRCHHNNDDNDNQQDSPCKKGKVLLCHYPSDDFDKRHEICVGKAAVMAHLERGDKLGHCLSN